ncbi:MAG: hypothetical protein SYC29_15240 [Planctomycetota bacterium]|nr:hypothetical protein [Planctomycetota bacterium]
MGGPIASLMARFRRADRVGQRPRGGSPSPAETALSARSLADAIERAIDRGRWAHAERIARSALPLAATSARLSEQVARLRLAQGRPETALTIIESPRARGEMNASLRLLRAVCLVQVGRKEEAHSDLLRWSKKSTAPLDARLMLALLEWEAGDEHAATLALLRNLKHLEDNRTLELLLLLAVRQGRAEQSGVWARRLRECSAFGAGSPYLNLLCDSLLLPQAGETHEPTPDQVDTLRLELIAGEGAIATLVAAQQLRPQRDVARLLYRALEQALDDLADPSPALEALARLALILEDLDAARNWTDQALQRHPMSASLALLREEIERAGAGSSPAPSQEKAA